jgi:hypothetical protein
MILELRTYRVVPGRAADLVSRMTEVLPLLAAQGIDALGVRESVQHEGGEHLVLVRAFESATERDRLEEAFYGGDAWLNGPRGGVMELIEDYHTVVLDVSPETVESLRADLARSA